MNTQNPSAKQPRQLPQSTVAAPAADDVDPSIVVLDTLGAIADALEVQATISAAQFLLNNAPEDEMPTLRASPAIQNAKAAALAYLRDAGQNGDNTASE